MFLLSSVIVLLVNAIIIPNSENDPYIVLYAYTLEPLWYRIFFFEISLRNARNSTIQFRRIRAFFLSLEKFSVPVYRCNLERCIWEVSNVDSEMDKIKIFSVIHHPVHYYGRALQPSERTKWNKELSVLQVSEPLKSKNKTVSFFWQFLGFWIRYVQFINYIYYILVNRRRCWDL